MIGILCRAQDELSDQCVIVGDCEADGRATSGGRVLSDSLSTRALPDREQPRVAAQENRPFEMAGEATSRTPRSLRARISGVPPRLDHDRLSCLADEIDLAIGRDRGGKEHAVESRLPDALACLHVGAGQHADIVGQVQQPFVGDERRGVRAAAGRAPDDMARAYVAASARAQREYGLLRYPRVM